MTPWALLEDAICRGKDSSAAQLFIEYLRATRGKAVISLKGAKKLCERYSIDMNVDDFADANKSGESEIFATLSSKAYDRMLFNKYEQHSRDVEFQKRYRREQRNRQYREWKRTKGF